MAHTPGPWIYDPLTCSIIAPEQWAIKPDEWQDGIPICVVELRSSMGGDDSEADKCLLLAAPDLLDALETMLTHFSTYEVGDAMKAKGDGEEYHQTLNLVYDAIAKATKEEN